MRSVKTPKNLKPIIKFDGTELTKEDIHHLYIIDRLNIATMAFIFDVDELTMFFHARKYGYGHRKAENGLYGRAYDMQKKTEKRFELFSEKRRQKEQEKRDRETWEEAARLYGKPKPEIQYITVNGRKFADRDLLDAYNRNVKVIYNQLKYRKRVGLTTKPKELNTVSRVALSAMRLHRGLDMFQFSKESGIPYNTVVFYEKTQYALIPKELSDKYFEVLKISKREYKKILECLSGERKTMFEEEDRIIPEGVRTIVWERDKGKCTKCGREEYLHYHHVTHFSKGGEHKAKNLKLLCVGCHAAVHFGEPGYAMLKAKADKLGVSVNVS